MVVDHAHGLHVGIDDGRAHEAETTQFQIFRQRVGFAGVRGKAFQRAPMVHARSPADEAPHVAVERTEFFLHRQERPRIRDGGRYFQAIAHNAGVPEQAPDVARAEARHARGVEVRERLAVVLALAQNRDPTQARLGAFEHQKLEVLAVVVHRYAPLGVVVADIQWVGTAPTATWFVPVVAYAGRILFIPDHGRSKVSEAQTDSQSALVFDGADNMCTAVTNHTPGRLKSN